LRRGIVGDTKPGKKGVACEQNPICRLLSTGDFKRDTQREVATRTTVEPQQQRR